ncbi:MAG: hypothetical protein M3R69_18810 [Acidobacteriota bacterium]|nr:hypothetical protein [Acidobacteriota bacterium]
MAKITGIGGVFFKAKTDNRALREWYQKHLGIKLDDWGGCGLEWAEDTSFGRFQAVNMTFEAKQGKSGLMRQSLT